MGDVPKIMSRVRSNFSKRPDHFREKDFVHISFSFTTLQWVSCSPNCKRFVNFANFQTKLKHSTAHSVFVYLKKKLIPLWWKGLSTWKSLGVYISNQKRFKMLYFKLILNIERFNIVITPSVSTCDFTPIMYLRSKSPPYWICLNLPPKTFQVCRIDTTLYISSKSSCVGLIFNHCWFSRIKVNWGCLFLTRIV